MLFIMKEMTFSGYKDMSLDLMYMIAMLCGLLVILSKNPMVSVLFLMGLFLSMSCYLMLTGLNFMGLSYLLVYMGAVSMLFMFMLMLINVSVSELLMDSLNSMPLAILVGILFNFFMNNVLPYMVMMYNNLLYVIISSKMAHVTSVAWDSYLAENSHMTSMGNMLYGSYSIWLMITSIMLLLAMVGCIVMTLKEKDN